MLDLAKVECADFEACLQEDFRIATTGGEFALKLVEARTFGTAPPGGTRTPFVLTFRGPSGLRLQQAIYHLENARLGAMQIFLVQVADDANGSSFEAVFS